MVEEAKEILVIVHYVTKKGKKYFVSYLFIFFINNLPEYQKAKSHYPH
jgi:hypothetical protein